MRRGLTFGAAAYLIWGLFPLFFPLLEPAGWLEILAQRMVWSLVVVAGILAITTGFAGVRAVLRDRRRAARLMLAGVLITVNWGVYIWGVNAQIQGDQLRVSGKKRDDLQAVIALLKDADLDIALQFTNYR